MQRHDDPNLSGDLLLYRRVPPDGGRVVWNAGVPTASTQNFKDKNDELSVCIAGETLPEAALAGHEGFGLVQFTAGLVRKVIADFKAAAFLCRDPLPEMPGHALICGRVTDGMARQIRAAAVWVDGCWPRRPAG